MFAKTNIHKSIFILLCGFTLMATALIFWPTAQVYADPITEIGLMLTDSGIYASDVNHCGNVGVNEIWSASGNVHIVTCDVKVTPGNTLTIEAGAIVKFQSGTQLDVEGELFAIGTINDPIYFTSYKDDSVGGDTNGDGGATTPATGDWGAIQFLGGNSDSEITRAYIKYSGLADCCGINDGAIELSNASPTLSYISFSDNYVNGALISGAQDWSTTIWDNTTIVYVIENGYVNIPNGHTLTIDPDMKIKLSAGSDIFVNGKLLADGTESQPIYFTSYKDDTVCGIGVLEEDICDTHNDGNLVPTLADWGVIEFSSSSDPTSSISRAAVKYSGLTDCCGINDGAIRLTNASPNLSHITFDQNYINGVQITGLWDWSSDTWDNTTVVYVIDSGYVNVPAGNTLTIEPGIKVKLNSGADILVKGKLDADGTILNPTYFTSYKDDTVCGTGAFNEDICDTHNDGNAVPLSGDWGMIEFSSSSDPSSSISRAVVKYSGTTDCCGINDGAIRLTNASPNLSYITFDQNYINGVQILGNIVWQTDTWNNDTVVYMIEGNPIIPSNNTLTIPADTKIKFTPNSDIIIDGTLNAVGTLANPIFFTSYLDDSVCGIGAFDEPICDSHNDGAVPATVGNWGGIYFNATSTNSKLHYATVTYGGQSDCCGNNDGAININGSSPTIAYNKIVNNADGIDAYNNATPTLNCNDIYDNILLGIRNQTVGVVISAKNHWWGAASGPSHSGNPGGLGQTVSDGITYSPWANQSCLIPPPVYTDFLYLPFVNR